MVTMGVYLSLVNVFVNSMNLLLALSGERR